MERVTTTLGPPLRRFRSTLGLLNLNRARAKLVVILQFYVTYLPFAWDSNWRQSRYGLPVLP